MDWHESAEIKEYLLAYSAEGYAAEEFRQQCQTLVDWGGKCFASLLDHKSGTNPEHIPGGTRCRREDHDGPPRRGFESQHAGPKLTDRMRPAVAIAKVSPSAARNHGLPRLVIFGEPCQ